MQNVVRDTRTIHHPPAKHDASMNVGMTTYRESQNGMVDQGNGIHQHSLSYLGFQSVSQHTNVSCWGEGEGTNLRARRIEDPALSLQGSEGGELA